MRCLEINRKLRPTKSTQQLKDEQMGFMLEEIQKDIENFKLIISKNIRKFTTKKHTTGCQN